MQKIRYSGIDTEIQSYGCQAVVWIEPSIALDIGIPADRVTIVVELYYLGLSW